MAAKVVKKVKEGKGEDETSEYIKSKRPQPKKVLAKTAKARLALASGQISQAESEVKKLRDLRTLYVKFKKNCPKDFESMKQLFPLAQCVRAKNQRKANEDYKFCFVEYATEAACVFAKSQLEASSDLYFVDFVGEKSRNVKSAKTDAAKARPVNPVRLCVTGIPEDMPEEKLRLLFPKSVFAVVKRSKSAGFVTFQNPGDTRAAFDKVRRLMQGELPAGIPKLTVVFAKLENLNKRATERQRKRKQVFAERIAENFKKTKKNGKPTERKSTNEDSEDEVVVSEGGSDEEEEEEKPNVADLDDGTEANANETESDDDEEMANDEESDDDEDVANDEESDDE